MTWIWWLIPFVLQWDGKLTATYLRSNRPSLHCNPVKEPFVCLLQPNWMHQLESVNDCVVCACVYNVRISVFSLSKTLQAFLKSGLNYRISVDDRIEIQLKDGRAADSCCCLSPLWSQPLSSCQACWNGKCLILERNSPPFPLFWTTPNPTWTPTGTQRAAWLHVPTMRPHKKHQVSRTGRSFLKRLSMQLFCPALLSSQSVSGECNI